MYDIFYLKNTNGKEFLVSNPFFFNSALNMQKLFKTCFGIDISIFQL